MCQSKVEKEDVFINQNAVGGKNDATFHEMKYHLSAISIVMMVICTLLAIGFLYCCYKLYKKCHTSWSNDLIVRYNLRRSFIRDQRESRCRRCESANQPGSSGDK